jgi:murein DD-endopeptidase MepM/ murein hydrolase activator NlpD
MCYKKYILYILIWSFILIGCVPLHYSKARGETGPGIYHTVKKGETLWRIAKTYKVPLKRIAEANHLPGSAFIKVGQKLFIPGVTETKEIQMPDNVTAQKNTMPAEISVPGSPPVVSSRASEYNRKNTGLFIWPVKGKVVSDFGSREQQRHLGIDIRAANGTPVLAARTGKVIYSGATLPGYGNVVIIEHDRDFSTVYAHNSINLVKDGITVQKGQIIAYVGSTGRSTASHLHFELRRRGHAENPLDYLPH